MSLLILPGISSIGINLNGNGIVKNTFKNVPQSMISSWEYPTPGPTNSDVYYIE